MNLGICSFSLKLCFDLVCYLEAFKMGLIGWEWHQRNSSACGCCVIVILLFRSHFS